MTLACSPYFGNEYAMNADLMLLEVSPTEAGRLIEAMERCRVFLREMKEAGLAGRGLGHVAIPSPIQFRLFGTLPAVWETALEQTEEEDWLEVTGEDAALDELANDAFETELDCHQLLVYQNAVYVTALSRYGGDSFETRALPRTMIEEIAQGGPLSKTVSLESEVGHGLRADV